MKVPRSIAVLAAFILATGIASAQTLIDPSVSAYSSQMTEYQNAVDLHREAVNVVNGSGMSNGGAANSLAGTVSDTNEWWINGNTNGATPATPDYAPSITFNLGSVYNVTTLRIWNENQNDIETGFFPAPQLGARLVAVYAGLTPGTLSFIGNETFTEGTGSPLLPQNISVFIPDVQYVEYKILSNWDGATFVGNPSFNALAPDSNGGADGRGLVGLSEIRFAGVPEPSTYAMMLAGLVFLGVCLRRKNASFKA